MLSDSEQEPELSEFDQLTINEHYAKAFARRKEREELAKLKEKYGSDVGEDVEESEDDEDTTEDEDGEELTPAVDAAILRTLARIKRKDPSIYDSAMDVFDAERKRTNDAPLSKNAKKVKDNSKPLLLKQHILESTLRGTSRSPSPILAEPTHVEEQAALRQETISAFHGAVAAASDVNGEEDFLVPREKTKDEIEREEEEYREFLAREVGDDIGNLITVESNGTSVGDGNASAEERQAEEKIGKKDEKKEKKNSGEKRVKTKEQEDHEFLMSYILNRGWIDRSSRKLPTYHEITGAAGQKTDDLENGEAGDVQGFGSERREELDEDELDDVVDNFESSYNFRFEEPDAVTIKTHPRNIVSTVRREENPRKAARERKKARKEEKMHLKKEEVKRLKSLKLKELREKLDRIKKEGGKSADDEALLELDLEGDWDPDAYDAQMANVFKNNDGDGDGDDKEKPTWDDDIDITDIVPKSKKAPMASASKKKYRERTKRKRDDIGDEDMDEVYGYDFHDMIGDMPIRFKYVQVAPESYGLTTAEILLADEADLNDFVGLKKLAPYRKDKGRSWDSKRAEKLEELRKTLRDKYGSLPFDSRGMRGETKPKRKKKGKKERQKAKLLAEDTVSESREETVTAEKQTPEDAAGDHDSSRKKRKRSLKDAST